MRVEGLDFSSPKGECVNEKGLPINDLLAEALGWPFITGYIASYMLVAMGIFNVILAVYVACLEIRVQGSGFRV